MDPGCVNEWKKLMVDLWESGETEDAADGVRVCVLTPFVLELRDGTFLAVESLL